MTRANQPGIKNFNGVGCVIRLLSAALTFGAAGDFALRHTELAQDRGHGAEIGQAELEQIQAHEGREGQEPAVDEQGAGFHAQRQRDHDEQASHHTDISFYGHFKLLKNQTEALA